MKKENRKNVLVQIDEKVYQDFKIVCVKKGISIRDGVEKLMKNVVETWKEK